MTRITKLLAISLLLLLPACGGDDGGTGPTLASLTGTWTGKFSNGIPITVPLVQTGTTLGGTFDTGDTQGTVSGTHSATAFTLELTKTSASGTQRSLTSPVLNTAKTRITANWDDGQGGQSGTFCLAAPASTLCP